MNPRVKSVFKGVATGLALAAALYNGIALYNDFTQGDEPAAVPTQDFSVGTSQKPTFTAEEMAGAEKFASLQGCIEAGKLGQSMAAGGKFEMAETAQQAFDRAVAKCEATVDAANDFVNGLNRKYGDALETVYQNSVPQQQPVGPQ